MNHDNMKTLVGLAEDYMRKKTMKIVAEPIKKRTEEEVFKSRLEVEADMIKRHMAGGWDYEREALKDHVVHQNWVVCVRYYAEQSVILQGYDKCRFVRPYYIDAINDVHNKER